MTDIDLDKLGTVWRGSLADEQISDLVRSARKVSRRARIGLMLDQVGAALVVLAVLVIVAVDGEADTIFFGSVAILVLVLSQLRQRRYRQIEVRSLTGGTEAMIEQLIERQRASLKRVRFGLWIIGPATVAGVLFASTIGGSAEYEMLSRRIADPQLRIVLMGLATLLITGTAVHLALTIRRYRGEIERLMALRDAYRREHESSRTDGA
ncbi:MAG TPA: hypothetical protein VGW34_13830 [Allosphingosinicella sp.]|nr:hypothetical protein [Allosphingosinicella sp.]